jgi:tetrahydromethanopterin S-methyltransferase subunit A
MRRVTIHNPQFKYFLGAGCMWVHMDGESGASYWDNGVDEKSLIETVGFKKTTKSTRFLTNCILTTKD